jgi:hypothetical protein
VPPAASPALFDAERPGPAPAAAAPRVVSTDSRVLAECTQPGLDLLGERPYLTSLRLAERCALVAEDTREGQVFQRLFEKLDERTRRAGLRRAGTSLRGYASA